MQKLLLGLTLLISMSSFGSSYRFLGKCMGEHQSGTKFVVSIFQNQNQDSMDLVTIGQKGDSDFSPHEALVSFSEDFSSITFNVHDDSIKLSAHLEDGFTRGVSLKTDSHTFKSMTFSCNLDL